MFTTTATRASTGRTYERTAAAAGGDPRRERPLAERFPALDLAQLRAALAGQRLATA
ncbi:MAG TPA: hypothetical protein VIJ66_04630 [Solirubrobacteraceae bacterium]